MPFTTQCTNKDLHQQWGCQSNNLLHASKIPADAVRMIHALANRHVPTVVDRDTKFCEDCICYAQERNPELFVPKGRNDHRNQIKSFKKTSDAETQTDRPILDIEDPDFTNLTDHQRQTLAYHIARFERQFLKKKTDSIRPTRAQVQDLLGIEPNAYLQKQNGVVREFVRGISNSDEANTDSNNGYRLCKTVEQVLSLVSRNVIMPVHFREAIIMYQVTGSKLALKTISAASPYGSYESVHRWLQGLACNKPDVPTGDILVSFDNNQVLQRRWRVKLDNKINCNVVTMLVFFHFNGAGNLQFESDLHPSRWTDKELSQEEWDRIGRIDKDKDVKQTHYNHLYPFLLEKMKKVAEEQREDDEGNWKDSIDDKVAEKEHKSRFKRCPGCGDTEVPIQRQKCPMCSAPVTKAEMKRRGLQPDGSLGDPPARKKQRVACTEPVKVQCHGGRIKYLKQESQRSLYKISSQNHDENPNVQVRPPLDANPCSYEKCVEVLREIGKQAGIKRYGGDREWTVVSCDGLPYNLCRRVIRSTDEFDWVVLQPGSGHIEINMVRGFVELTWDVFFKRMCILFNFRSENALKCAKKVTDHHKGWTLCRIAHEAIVEELLVPFVREQLDTENPDLNPYTFMTAVATSPNPNYSFMGELILEFLDSIFLYRAGVRSGRPEVIDAGRGKFAKLWCGRNHPMYRELELADTLLLTRMPDEVRELAQKTQSLNMTGKPNTSEGADFRLEEINRKVQQWLPKAPKQKDWEVSCANNDQLSKFRDTVFSQSGTKDPSSNRHHQDITSEIIAFRTLLREEQYLTFKNDPLPHVNLDGEELDTGVREFAKSARKKRALFAEAYRKHEKEDKDLQKPTSVPFNSPPIFVTRQERTEFEAIENQTKQQLSVLIEAKIGEIEDQELREGYMLVWETEFTRKKGQVKKEDYIAFYYGIKDYVDNMSDQDVASDTEDE